MTADDLRAAPSRTARTAVLAAATLTIMAAAIIAPSLPAMSQVYADVPGADVLVRLSLTVTSLAIALSAPPAGLVADRVGRRPLLVAGLVLYAVGGTAGVLGPDLWLLIVTRVLLGVGVGAIMTAITALITDWFDGPERARFLGLQQAFASLGGVVFLPLAGVLAQLTWTAPFWLYAVALAVLPLALATVRDVHRAGPRAPRAGRVPGAAWPVYAVALLATLVFFLAPTQLPFLLETAFAVGPAGTGAVIAGSTASGAVGALAFPALRRRLGAGVLTAAGVALLGVGWLLIGTAGQLAVLVAGLLVGGAGVGLAVPTLNLRLSELASPQARAGVLSGLVTAVFLGQFLSPLAAQPLIEVAGIAGAFTWTGIAAAAYAAVAYTITERKR